MPDARQAQSQGQVTIRDVSKSYDSTLALSAIDLEAAPGEFIALLGPSGCGKTTLLRCIAGLVDVDRGDIRVGGRSLLDVPPWKRDVSVVFQNYALFPHMNVRDNVSFGLRMRGLDPTTTRRRVEQALELVRMSDLSQRMPSQLSGGQQQRVALARAIVVEPTVLLLDEPLAALDAKLRSSVRLEIRALQQRLGVTTILVTHDQEEAMTMSDRIAVMNAGRIEQVGAPIELYRSPATPFVADFVGETNHIQGHVIAEQGGFRFRMDGLADRPAIALATHVDVAPGPATLMIRPENIRLASGDDSGQGLPGIVQQVALLGDRYAVIVMVGSLSLRTTVLNEATRSVLPVPGERVSLLWRPDDTLVFCGHV